MAATPLRDDPPPGSLRVLLVEDDEADAFLVRELLDEVRAPVTLSVASNLRGAEHELAAGGIDCVLLDLGLPDAQGLSALRRLQQMAGSGAKGVAVCVLTGFGDDRLGTAALVEGAQDYLIKGQVDGAGLARAIRYAVQRQRAEEHARRLHQVELRQREHTRLERGLLPHPRIDTTEVRVDTYYQAGGRAQLGADFSLGGDFYDVVQTGPARLSLMIGDVCGMGAGAAALGVQLRVAWRALTLASVDDNAVLPAMDQLLRSEREGQDVFATIAMVTVAMDTMSATVRLAGHPPPLLCTAGSAAPVPSTAGPVLGVFEQASWPAVRTSLTADWALLLYTDGLIDGHIDDGTERLGTEGLQGLIARALASGVCVARLPAWLAQEAQQANDGPLADDVAMLLLTPFTSDAALASTETLSLAGTETPADASASPTAGAGGVAGAGGALDPGGAGSPAAPASVSPAIVTSPVPAPRPPVDE